MVLPEDSNPTQATLVPQEPYVAKKRCRVCKQYKPVNSFYVGAKGIQGHCIKCAKIIANAQYKNRIEHHDPLTLKAKHIRHHINQNNKKNGIPLLSVDDTYQLLKAHPHCECCGKAFVWDREHLLKSNRSPDAPTIDQIRPGKGYSKDNIGVICINCNLLKSYNTLDSLRTIMDYINKRTAAPKS